ncbi:MAG: bifunctional DNA-formamidopyrimidine glycosylase/DNA-(apurinic or apyrimidinic site) lyase [Kangiellaceae bacterium]|nr:bifunctional DNA-formamidopyrimidine glycosylase/DNA-(apurinic or apyrimidinic site) lyase [Kangiellaceae bacterium]
MPELPEVETTCRGVKPHAVGHVITEIIIRQPKLRWPIDLTINKKLSGQTINKISRRAKYLLIEMPVGTLMIHLGMSGSLKIVTDQAVEKHDHVDICLSNGKSIRFNDPRRFGSVLYSPKGEQHKLLKKLGVEPLSDDFLDDYLYQKAIGRKIPIKSFIMNNQIVVGVGNIYAQESLFLAGIHPNRPANKVSKKRMVNLLHTIRLVLTQAIEAGGSSLKDFTGADGKPGYFQQTLAVYGRQGQSCDRCLTKLKHLIIGQRATVYCPRCQR